MWRTGLVALWHVGSSRPRDQTRVPCIGRQILNHCTTREVQVVCFFDIELHELLVYFLEINPLSVALFVNIFSHSEGCLFVLFVVSFAVQKLLSFIRSHLFMFISIFLGGGSKRILLRLMSEHSAYVFL